MRRKVECVILKRSVLEALSRARDTRSHTAAKLAFGGAR